MLETTRILVKVYGALILFERVCKSFGAGFVSLSFDLGMGFGQETLWNF